MSAKRLHFEEFLYLPALTHEAVIIAWGGFFFEVTTHHDKEKWRLLDADEAETRVGRREAVGEKSKPYGSQARVELTELGGGNPLVVFIAGANSAVVSGLKPDTAYEYRVMVTDETGVERQWAAGPLHDWVLEGDEGHLREGGRYDNTFRTFPDPKQPTPAFAFAVIGDFGRGIRQPSANDRCQREVAEALIAAATRHDIRLMLTTGDNIYAKTFLGIPVSSSGDEDDDWFFTYFQPYRYLINRFPVFPSCRQSRRRRKRRKHRPRSDLRQLLPPDTIRPVARTARIHVGARFVLSFFLRPRRRIHLPRHLEGRFG